MKKPSRPQRPGCLDDWQVITASDDERACEAAVRNATATLEVLALQHTPDDHWRFLGDGASVPDLLDSSAAAQIAGQRLRLPTALCAKHRNAACPSEDIIKTLECQTGDLVPHWQQSPLLKGELLLAFDENGDAQLNGYHLHYSPLLGLQYETEGAHG